VKSTSGSAFVRRAFFHYLIRYRPWSLGRSQRTPDTVKKSYDVERARERDAQLDYESVVFGPPDEEDFVLENDRVHFGKLSQIRRRYLESMVTSFEPWIATPPPIPSSSNLAVGAAGISSSFSGSFQQFALLDWSSHPLAWRSQETGRRSSSYQ
jgi:hypothetical protein